MNLIIQHFVPGRAGLDPDRQMDGDMPMLVKRSMENVSEYAKKFGADYKMLNGTPFRSNLSYKCQKCAIINEEYDDYDVVVAMDTDAFFTKHCTDNVFEETGIAYSGEMQASGSRRIKGYLPNLGNENTSFWSGAIYVLDKQTRLMMRSIINDVYESAFEVLDQKQVWDEGIFHILAAGIGIEQISLDQTWNYDSYRPGHDKANMIHVRHKPQKRDDNYRDLVKRGII
jgi:hypothetical protein